MSSRNRRTYAPTDELVADITAAVAAVADSERQLLIAVCRAREDVARGWYHREPGATWEDIGELLGVSKQAAAKRFAGWRYDAETDQLVNERRLPLA